MILTHLLKPECYADPWNWQCQGAEVIHLAFLVCESWVLNITRLTSTRHLNKALLRELSMWAYPPHQLHCAHQWKTEIPWCQGLQLARYCSILSYLFIVCTVIREQKNLINKTCVYTHIYLHIYIHRYMYIHVYAYIQLLIK